MQFSQKMPSLKAKDLKNMGKDERDKKLAELKMELIKAKSQSAKGGSSRIKEIKKIMARIYTIDKRPVEKKKSDEKEKSEAGKKIAEAKASDGSEDVNKKDKALMSGTKKGGRVISRLGESDGGGVGSRVKGTEQQKIKLNKSETKREGKVEKKT